MITIKLYANLREAAGKEVTIAGEGTLGEVLEKLFQKHPSLRETVMEGEELREHFNILLNGRNVKYLKGLDTWVKDGDEIAIFPPVAGGETGRKTIKVRGVPRWAVEEYLRELGAIPEKGVYRCIEDGWSAELMPGESAEIRVELTGPADRVERIKRKLRLKCLRAGG